MVLVPVREHGAQRERYSLRDVLSQCNFKVRMVPPIRALLVCSVAGLGLSLSACQADVSPIERKPAGSGGGSTGVDVDPDGKLPDGTPAMALLPARIRRLTNAEYDASVKSLTGTALTPGQSFAPDLRQDGYTLNEAQRVDPLLAKQLFAGAEAIAAEVKANLQTFAPCSDPVAQAESCATSFIQDFGGKAYRRPLDQAETDALLAVYRAAAMGATYADGIELVVSAVLQSAGFLYLTELGEGDAAVRTLTSYELASSLAYLLTEGPPDAPLIEAALAGELATPEGREAQARRLLAAGGRGRVVRVLQEWLGLDRMAVTAKDTNVYPEFEGVKPSMIQETTSFINELLDASSGTVGEFLSADWTMVDAPLSALYGASGEGRVTMGGRRGILNQGAFLAVHAHAHESAPVLRGVAVARRVACLTIPSPTELNINVVPPVPDPSKTTRERFAIHSTDNACAACHSAIDNLGFAFEHFDGMGKYRDTDNSLPVDSSVTLTAGTDFDGTYADSNELAVALAQSATVKSCFARQLFHASAGTSGPPALPSEEAFVSYWAQQPAAAEGDIEETLVAFVKSSLFAQRRDP